LPINTAAALRYDATADGQKFVIVSPEIPPEPPVTVILNWRAQPHPQ
jgi:hypothetical protein